VLKSDEIVQILLSELYVIEVTYRRWSALQFINLMQLVTCPLTSVQHCWLNRLIETGFDVLHRDDLPVGWSVGHTADKHLSPSLRIVQPAQRGHCRLISQITSAIFTARPSFLHFTPCEQRRTAVCN